MLILIHSFGPNSHASATIRDGNEPVQTTLPNGLRVVIVPNSIAPIVTVEMNVLVGGNDSPVEYPGIAHAQEHMAFRGCMGMNSDQTAAIYAQLGGEDDAETEQTVTQYYATVPSSDLEVALRAQAACMRGMFDSQEEWSRERGAIKQEVAEDLSDPWYRLSQRVNQDMFAGSPYAHDSLGTERSFDATTGQMLKEFHQKWYAPNNMILVIVGNVNPESTLARVRELYGDIPQRPIPPHAPVELHPVRSETFTLENILPTVVGVVALRLPGTDSPDYAATVVLADVLSSRRSRLFEMESSGKVISADFELAESYPKASVGYAEIELPVGSNSSRATTEIQQVLTDYAKKGVPDDLVEAAKRGELAHAEFQRNSIPGLADVWSNALAAEGRNSPDEDIEDMRRVTTSDVDRIARQFLVASNAVVGTMVPSFNSSPSIERRVSDGEKATTTPSRSVKLPSWATEGLEQLTIPTVSAPTSDTTLKNGLRLIVKTDSTSPTILLRGSVKRAIQVPSAVDYGTVAEILAELYEYGSQRMDRLSFEKALDDIAATETAGYTFSLDVLKGNFSRGVQLLADHELHPTLRSGELRVVKQQISRRVMGSLRTPSFRSSQALATALLPPGDPEMFEITPASLSGVSLEVVKQFHEATIRPDLTTIVVVGDISPTEARAVIERSFGDWKAVGSRPQTSLPPVPPNKTSSVHIVDPDSLQDSVTIAEELDLDRFDEDYYPLQIGSAILGGASGGTRLYHDLRQVAGYVYSVDLGLDASEKRARFSISYGSAPENTARARSLIQRDLEEMRTSKVSEYELHQAKAFLLRQIQLSESSEADIAESLLDRAESGLPLDEPRREIEQYMRVTAEQVKKAFIRRIRPSDFVQIVRGPSLR